MLRRMRDYQFPNTYKLKSNITKKKKITSKLKSNIEFIFRIRTEENNLKIRKQRTIKQTKKIGGL